MSLMSVPCFSLRFCTLIIYALLATANRNSQAAQGAAIPQQSPVSLTAIIPADAVTAPSALLLEIELKNVSDKEVCIGASATPLWMTFDIDVRDAQERKVPETEAARARRLRRLKMQTISRNVAIILRPGQTSHTVVLLDRLYDLTRPGNYTVQVQRADFNVKSQVVNFKVPEVPEKLAKPPISVSITPLLKSVAAGWKLPVRATIRNASRKTVRLAIWEGIDRETHLTQAAQEFAAGAQVSGPHGSSVPLVPNDQAFFAEGRWTEGYFHLVPILPGEAYENTIAIGSLSDVSTPGRYRVRLTFAAPNGSLARSNVVSFDVEGGAQASGRAELPPPFVLTIRPGDETESDTPVLRCMTNISDHEIKLDNSITHDRFKAWDRKGVTVAMTESGEYIRRSFGNGNLSNVYSVPAGGSLCGGSTVSDIFRFETPGRYALQIGHVAATNPQPDKSYENGPVVTSDTIFVTVSR